MKKTDVNRRDFNKLTMAAFGGLMTGAVAGCGGQKEGEGGTSTGTDSAEEGGDAQPTETAMADNPLLEEPHVCRGLNTCKGKGAGGENECAGQGTCASAEHHACHGENACKGQGGCGETAGQNDCKGMGECDVPLGDDAWTAARAKLEELMSAQGKTLGPAPEKS